MQKRPFLTRHLPLLCRLRCYYMLRNIYAKDFVFLGLFYSQTGLVCGSEQYSSNILHLLLSNLLTFSFVAIISVENTRRHEIQMSDRLRIMMNTIGWWWIGLLFSSLCIVGHIYTLDISSQRSQTILGQESTNESAVRPCGVPESWLLMISEVAKDYGWRRFSSRLRALPGSA